MASLMKRGDVYYAQYYLGGKQKRICLDTSSLQIAKEKIRKIESSFFRGDDMPLPTKTLISKAVTDYIEHMGTIKTARSAERDIYYLREAFGPICPALTLKNIKISQKSQKRNYRDNLSYFSSPQTYDSGNIIGSLRPDSFSSSLRLLITLLRNLPFKPSSS